MKKESRIYQHVHGISLEILNCKIHKNKQYGNDLNSTHGLWKKLLV